MFLTDHPTLYLVTTEIGEDIEKWETRIVQAIAGGVKIVQIRDKVCSAQKLIAAARKIHPLLKIRGIPLIINDRVDIAYALKADGVHLGQSDLKVAEARAILGRKAMIGLSVETVSQALEAAHEDISYLAASPVFQTNTKTDCSEPWGLDGLRDLCSISKHPVIAIGGIDLTNVEAVVSCGVAGVALVSAVFDAPCPETAARDITNKLNRFSPRDKGIT